MKKTRDVGEQISDYYHPTVKNTFIEKSKMGIKKRMKK